jgi:hypothetical protein
VVGTPIGNLEDFSPRAKRILSEVDFIAAEDTRVTVKLLNHLGISKPMVAYFTPVIRLEAARKDAISGDGLLTAQGSFYNGSFGVQKNSLQLRWRLNEGSWQTLVPTLDGNGFSASADLSGMDYTRSHKVTLEVTDALHTITAQGDIQPGIPVFDWGARDFAFHVPLSMNGEKITNVKTPTDAMDAVNKAYIDSLATGVTAPVNGFFSLSVDANGDLWVHTSGDGNTPAFAYDSSTGDLYFLTE